MSELIEKPLVTFALFAYNQEKYIREAIAGAFAQDYSPLEIILSDDSSTDRTFEIMQEMAETYEGPHRVLARKTVVNKGFLQHIAEVVELAHGVLLVLAAGDDVSKKNRTEVLIASWHSTGAWGLCSRYDRIDASGMLLESAVASAVLDGQDFKGYFYEEEGPVRIVHGCSSAYDIRLFNYLKLNSDDFILAEDGAMSVLLNLIGKEIVNLNDSLVLYRESYGSLTNYQKKSRISFAQIIEDEKRIEWFAKAQANRCKLFLRMNEYLEKNQLRKMNVDEVLAEHRRLTVRAEWRTLPYLSKITFAFRNLNLAWVWPRLFGLRLFYIVKWLSRRI